MMFSKPQIYHSQSPLALESGKTLMNYQLVYETYGTLNEDKSNVILICHALNASHHVAGIYEDNLHQKGWWDNMIGPNKSIDTNKFFVICINNLGSCFGSTGPNTINPLINKYFGGDFPLLTVSDWVNSQYQLLQSLNITKLKAVVGGSLGGMQVQQWALSYPDYMQHCVIIASTSQLSSQNIAFNDVARQAIMTDPDFHNGHFYEHHVVPHRGLKVARMMGHITYLSDDSFNVKFGRKTTQDILQYHYESEFEVESYLRYQGEKFSNYFDANTYLLFTKALDYFDPAQYYGSGDLAAAFSKCNAHFLVISFDTDWRFPPSCSEIIVQALLKTRKKVTYAQVKTPFGHDAFLLENPQYQGIIKKYLMLC
jgi:homoserine O-acetyltransferase